MVPAQRVHGLAPAAAQDRPRVPHVHDVAVVAHHQGYDRAGAAPIQLLLQRVGLPHGLDKLLLG